MSKLVDFGAGMNGECGHGKKSGATKAVYDAMPQLLVNFAEGSRINSGFRLLKQSA